ncbi:6-pyruvoyl-tetrahydropterin synthase-related protein [Pseudanabaena mucicola]|uniref:Membrane protein 6-pyruvoyl-tetrahydropterin synthase-related domain-containing protein n=1 Tax=Pseudanabaena mucicola FACHB-723 TaxID=2692860 RepID=A0ABR7ZY95_9CYAN|nr:6-pyruvoyl-tetrahydropterin synthase-related protein [Pseudanabaena mucicola]MBD2188946.1 hypothetical protein [Pseudanabaena mucicola FACHB-723]
MSKDSLTARSIKSVLLMIATMFIVPIIIIEFILRSLKTISSFISKIIYKIIGVRISPIINSSIISRTEESFDCIKLGLKSLSLVGISIIAMMPMLLHSYPMAHSTAYDFSWIFQYQRQFFAGQIYPRWLEFSHFGFGNPTFVFYPSTWALATLPFSLVGMDVPTSLVGSMVLASLTLAVGVYLYAAQYFPSWLALVISGLAVASPYFLIDVYQRGTMAEAWAIAFIPWVLLATHKLISQAHLPQMRRTHTISLAIAWGMLGLSHLPTLLVSFLAWLPMPLFILKDLLKDKSLKNYFIEVGRCYLSASLGFIGISFFLLPVIFDQKLVHIEWVNPGLEYFPQNRLMLDGLLNLHPHLPTHWFETSSGLIPYFWICLSVVMINIILWIAKRFFFSNIFSSQLLTSNVNSSGFGQLRLDSAALFWLIASAIVVLMTTDLTSWIYQLSPTLQKIQFSWRWYSVVITTIPLLWGYLMGQLWQQFPSNKLAQNLIQVYIFKFIVIVSLISIIAGYIYTDKIVFKHTGFDPARASKFDQLVNEIRFPKEFNNKLEEQSIPEWSWFFPADLSIIDAGEYRPKSVILPLSPYETAPLAIWKPDDSEEHIQIKRWQYGLREILVDNPSSEQLYLALRMFYYPAWQVWIDGKKGLLEQTSQGQAQIAIANGQHLVLVKYVGTLAEQLGRAISWFSIILTSYIFWRIKSIVIAK